MQKTSNYTQVQLHTKQDLEQILLIYNKLNKLTKVDRLLAADDISALHKILLDGIRIQNNIDIQNIIFQIISFITSNGIDPQPFYSMFQNTYFSVTSIPDAFSTYETAHAVCSGKNVALNMDIVTFDENGFLTGRLIDESGLMKQIITHELLHRISAFREDKEFKFTIDSAFSEGFTDLFAEIITKYDGPIKSEPYQFSKNVCDMLISMIGLKEAFNDYLNDFANYKNLKVLLQKYNMNFKEFETIFDKLLSMRYKVGENLANINDSIKFENDFLIEIRDKLIIPFIRDNPDKEEEIINKFNKLFADRGITINLVKKM